MTTAASPPKSTEIPPEIQADIEKFERHLADFHAGDLHEEIGRAHV